MALSEGGGVVVDEGSLLLTGRGKLVATLPSYADERAGREGGREGGKRKERIRVSSSHMLGSVEPCGSGTHTNSADVQCTCTSVPSQYLGTCHAMPPTPTPFMLVMYMYTCRTYTTSSYYTLVSDM